MLFCCCFKFIGFCIQKFLCVYIYDCILLEMKLWSPWCGVMAILTQRPPQIGNLEICLAVSLSSCRPGLCWTGILASDLPWAVLIRLPQDKLSNLIVKEEPAGLHLGPVITPTVYPCLYLKIQQQVLLCIYFLCYSYLLRKSSKNSNKMGYPLHGQGLHGMRHPDGAHSMACSWGFPVFEGL